jgi:hypothetical protein
LIVFTIKSSSTDTVYVGTTKDSIDERWALYQLAKDLPLEAPLYSDMRKHGVVCFSIEEYDFAETRQELAQMFDDAMVQYNGVSLKGMKTSMPRTAVYPTSEGAPPKPKVAVKKNEKSAGDEIDAKLSSILQRSDKNAEFRVASVKRQTQVEEFKPGEKLKLATGRTGSAIKEKKIKESIALEKQQRAALKQKQVAEQADEMKAILANLDSRGSTLRKRY